MHSLECGIVGLPNVGKSTLFNAMTRSQAARAENFPFCTIEPNVAEVMVADDRLDNSAKVCNSGKIIHRFLRVVDIAGLVSGASKGEGLGNKFVSHIREVDGIIHVVRCFEDDDIKHVHGNVDPVYDAGVVEMELMLADINSIENRLKKEKKDKELQAKLQKALSMLENGEMPRTEFADLQLLTTKQMIYACNVEQESIITGNKHTKKMQEFCMKNNSEMVVFSAAIEAEIAMLDDESDRTAFLNDLGLKRSRIDDIIITAYRSLNLITFFTVGPKEARAWSIPNGATAQQAAGVIHTDFAKKFIKAEVMSYEDFTNFNGEQGCKNAGKLRMEGKDYIVKDGDIMHFKHG